MKQLLINLTFLIYPEYLLKYFCTKKPARIWTGPSEFYVSVFNK